MNFIQSRILAANPHPEAIGLYEGVPGILPLARADADMRHVLDVLASLDGRPVEKCIPVQARQQPGLADAVERILGDQGRADGDPTVAIEMCTIATADGPLDLRLYRSLATDPTELVPALLYLHGGWVVGGLDAYAASARMLARRTGALVVAPLYRQAPEHRFPAGHEDAYAAWLWLVEEAEALGVDRGRMAVSGEGIGANMALNVALAARDEAMARPIHSALICPLAGNDLTLPSYAENAGALPLNTAKVRWLVRHAFASRADTEDPRIDLVNRTDLGGIGPVTLILAEIDPLRSEGQLLAEALAAQGVAVEATTYDGVTHDFFGLGVMVNKAMFAQSQVAGALAEAFARN